MWRNFILKYKGFWRRVKPVYVLYNLLQYKRLQYLKQLYKEYGVKKSVYFPIDSSDFKNLEEPHHPWMDTLNDFKEISTKEGFNDFPENIREQLMTFPQNGFLIWEQYLSHQEVDAINEEMDQLLDQGSVDFNYTGRKIMQAHEHSKAVEQVFKADKLQQVLSFILGRKVIPFQTIHFKEGSRQKAHSDSIHMSTFPKGYLIAAWWALEDVEIDAGPLFYYPSSHNLPYTVNEQFLEHQHPLLLGNNVNDSYEKYIAKAIKTNELKPQTFLAKKGDMLIWHANLLHGGMPVVQEGKTRKSLVAHYYAEGVICYHEISQRPAVI
jgi:ectoine hydroxylase-related dioxygenase (phytanoyl-CoA dioxygenase family)